MIANFGQWLCQPARYTLVSEYRRRVSAYLTKLATNADVVNNQRAVNGTGLDSKKLITVWLETHPTPVRNDKYVWDYKDGRTPSRLELFNRVANDVASSAIASGRLSGLLRWYGMLWSVIDISPDLAHLFKYEAGNSPVVETLLSLICERR
jgi:hypothetical protein